MHVNPQLLAFIFIYSQKILKKAAAPSQLSQRVLTAVIRLHTL